MKITSSFGLFKILIVLLLISASCNKDLKEISSVQDGSTDLSSLTASKANIILIIGDDVGREIPTYNGGQSYSTPNLDFMAANGKQFPYFFSHPDGPPSRVALVTGEYNYRNWVKFLYLPPSSLTFANMLKNTGYSTCFIGKWQFDGGDVSIKSHGFDKYLAYMPFRPESNNGHDQFYRRYKNPYLYENGKYLTDAQVKGKYSEDMFFNYASKFIDSNKTKPFLMIYSHNLINKPWCPSPDHPDYAAWDPAVDDDVDNGEDSIYFPSMVAYMDKIIGKLINKVQTAGLAQKTLIIFTSDNATYVTLRSYYKGKKIRGAKDSTVFDGINVPMIAYMPGSVAPGTVDTSLVDMTDFFPTFARIAGANTAPYKPLDGTSFYDNLMGSRSPLVQRSTVYCYWPREYQGKVDLSYVMNYTYKLYDSLNGSRFYDIRKDFYEKNPIPDNKLTPAEKSVKDRFTKILRRGFE
jgi:arylsulfatase A